MLENNGKILIIDDDKSVEAFWRRVFISRFGINSIYASDGQKGLYAMSENNCCGVILDVSMPVMDGFEVIKRIKADESYKNIPLIVLTAHNDKQIIRNFATYKPDDYLLKPISLMENYNRIASFVDKVKLYSTDFTKKLLIISENDEELTELLAERKIMSYSLAETVEQGLKIISEINPQIILLNGIEGSLAFGTLQSTFNELKQLGRKDSLPKSYFPTFFGINTSENIDTSKVFDDKESAANNLKQILLADL